MRPLEEYTLQELRMEIRWREKEIKSVARIARFLTERQLDRYGKYADEVADIKAHIARRTSRINKTSKKG